MSIGSLRAEHHLRIAGLPKVTQMILDSIPMCRRSTVRYVKHRYLDVGAGTECGKSRHLFGFTLGVAAGQHQGSDPQPRVGFGEGKQRATHPDGDVIAMRSDDSDFIDIAGKE